MVRIAACLASALIAAEAFAATPWFNAVGFTIEPEAGKKSKFFQLRLEP